MLYECIQPADSSVSVRHEFPDSERVAAADSNVAPGEYNWLDANDSAHRLNERCTLQNLERLPFHREPLSFLEESPNRWRGGRPPRNPIGDELLY